MISEASIQLGKVLLTANIDEARRYPREYFLGWIGIEPPLQFQIFPPRFLQRRRFFIVHH